MQTRCNYLQVPAEVAFLSSINLIMFRAHQMFIKYVTGAWNSLQLLLHNAPVCLLFLVIKYLVLTPFVWGGVIFNLSNSEPLIYNNNNNTYIDLPLRLTNHVCAFSVLLLLGSCCTTGNTKIANRYKAVLIYIWYFNFWIFIYHIY